MTYFFNFSDVMKVTWTITPEKKRDFEENLYMTENKITGKHVELANGAY